MTIWRWLSWGNGLAEIAGALTERLSSGAQSGRRWSPLPGGRWRLGRNSRVGCCSVAFTSR